MRTLFRFCAGVLSLLLLCPLVIAQSSPVEAASFGTGSQQVRALYAFTLPHDVHATVYSDGIAALVDKHKGTEMRMIPEIELPDKARVQFDLMRGPQQAFIPGRVIVVFGTGVQATTDVQTVSTPILKSMRQSAARHKSFVPPAYTTDATVNKVMGTLGISHIERMFRALDQSTLTNMHSRAQATSGRNLLDISRVYRLDVTDASVPKAVAELRKLSTIRYASADWRVAPMDTVPVRLPQLASTRVQQSTTRLPMATGLASSLPANYAVTTSQQSMLNAPSNDVMAAFDEIANTFHQLPGQGEIVTNISIGDLDDQNAANNPYDPCAAWAFIFGPTTVVINGQRYIDWPSMPLIPTYTSDNSGHVNGTGEVCGTDPFLGEVGLDFSMMAPLPHNQQRSSNPGSGITDLLGIAPGAQYRLVVPSNANVGLSDIDGAFIAAARQTPIPSVISASLGIGVDSIGFPGRYLEDDALTASLIAGIVAQYDIVVCISANDGLRLFTNASFGPSGGSAATNIASNPTAQTDINDIAFSTTPSEDLDTGSIDVGGTTLDDIFSAPPQNPNFASLRNQHAFPETRWNGFGLFSSGFGARVNVSAPSDNVVSFEHAFNQGATAIDVVLNGGTSASAPEVAAAAAIVRQVSRLTGHAITAVQVRQFLASTGRPIPNVSQADQQLEIGTAVDVRAALEKLLTQSGHAVAAKVSRVAIEQRRQLQANYATTNGGWDTYSDYLIETATDPSNIDLQGPISLADGANTGENEEAWITIAPDWEGLSEKATYKLYVTGRPSKVLATTPYARLLPEQILAAAGLPLVANSKRTVDLTYAVSSTRRLSIGFSLTFGPADATTREVLAPIVPSVVSSGSIPVTYDLTRARNLANPTLLVSPPGRPNVQHGGRYHPTYTKSLGGLGLKGTVYVPISALQGGGIYGIHILYGTITGPQGFVYQRRSDTAYVRVEPSPASDARPSAPLLSVAGGTPAHFLETPYGSPWQVTYDVRNVPGATGAIIEVSAAGPTAYANFNTFNNPNGTSRDHNGIDFGSLSYIPVSGTSGTATISGSAANLDATMLETVRIVPTGLGGVVGEAGDVSTITMDGVNPNDGGFLDSGFGINQNGHDGFITTEQSIPEQAATVLPLGDFATFDQSTNAMGTGLFGSPVQANPSSFQTYGWGIWKNDQDLVHLQNCCVNLNLLVDPNTVSPAGFWNPQIPSTVAIRYAAPNSASSIGAFVGFDSAKSQAQAWSLFSSNLSANTTNQIFDLSAPLQPYSNTTPGYFGVTQNPSTNTAVLIGGNFNGGNQQSIVTVDLGTGQMGVMPQSGPSGYIHGMALDSQTNKLVYLTDDDAGLNIFDLTTKTLTHKTLPVYSSDFLYPSKGFYAAADPTRRLFFVDQFVAPDVLQNNNSLSEVLIYDESGNLIATVEKFFFFNVGMPSTQAGLQLNPGTRTGYTFGPFQQQLQPFTY